MIRHLEIVDDPCRDPEWWELEVIGTRLTDAIRVALEETGVTRVESTETGFHAWRDLDLDLAEPTSR